MLNLFIVVRGRECQFEKDCMAIKNTSCVEDPLEPKTSRCLCGDNTAPVNGVCNNKHKGKKKKTFSVFVMLFFNPAFL